MNVRRMMSIIFFFVTVIIVLALAPSIQTSNDTAYATWGATSTNASMIGLGAIMPFGAPLIILSIMVSFGLLAFGIKEGATIKDSLVAVGVAVAQVVALTLFDTAIGYIDTLLTGSTGIATIIYGIIPLAVYLGIIVSSATVGGVQYYKSRKSKKGGAAPAMAY